ncbi:MAG TPA: PEP/pyruvate-binding domain-containing protein [Polyangia bacterium]|nr:PEP/pyruvate-binding domain-containing protein [Polyangia bacterium]
MRFCVPLTLAEPAAPPSDDDGTDWGGKARSLVRLAAAGLPVPPAFVVGASLFRAMRASGPTLPARIDSDGGLIALDRARAALQAAAFPDGFSDELRAQLRRIDATPGARWSVRSSFTSEDQPGALAAGLFQSVLDVATDDVAAAIRTVLGSALQPAALLYARRRRITGDAAAMAVLVHPYVAPQVSGSAAYDPAAGAAPIIDGPEIKLATAARAAIDAAVRALAAAHGAVEIEWVVQACEIVFLQMRPFAAGAEAPRWPGSSALGDGDWRWDASHNPAPLSPAQAGLIRLVDERCRIGLRQRVVGGYLFYNTLTTATTDAAATLADRLAATRDAVDRTLAALPKTPSLESALEAFVSLYQIIFGDLQPAARAARQALRAFMDAHGTTDDATLATLLDDVPSVASERRALAERVRGAPTDDARAHALAAYLERFGDEAAVWDVAAPTFAEDTALLDLRRAREVAGVPGDRSKTTAATLGAALPAADRPRFDHLLGQAREAVAAGEEDDHLYARVQATVRRALLREGRRLRDAGVLAAAADVFWLPLQTVRDQAAGAATLGFREAAARVAQTRAADEAARAHPPPVVPTGRRPTIAGDLLLRGLRGAGGRVVGRAFIYPDPSGAKPDDGCILVARTLLPTELPLLSAVGLITETGGVLGHVAAQARERRIPAVVSAAGACARLHTGDRVLVDGDSGTVLVLAGDIY